MLPLCKGFLEVETASTSELWNVVRTAEILLKVILTPCPPSPTCSPGPLTLASRLSRWGQMIQLHLLAPFAWVGPRDWFWPVRLSGNAACCFRARSFNCHCEILQSFLFPQPCCSVRLDPGLRVKMILEQSSKLVHSEHVE